MNKIAEHRITVARRFDFDYGHRVLGHTGKCRFLHGHHGVAEIAVSGPSLDRLGMVTDFSVIKKTVGDWINEFWDHALLLDRSDPIATVLGLDTKTAPLTDQIYLMDNPTAENMAAELFWAASRLLPDPLQVLSVRLWETPNCSAQYRRESLS